MSVLDARICELGEGALWHPLREELFWFDITGRRLLSHHPASGATTERALPEMASAAAWIDAERLLVATETALALLDLRGEALEVLTPLEADNPDTRSNDGRADPWGGFWIGTMGKAGQAEAGALYRFHGGELRRLADGITTPNALCFAPDRPLAYFADTRRALLFRVALDAEGWPAAEPEIFVDFGPLGLKPDGAVTDAAGNLRIALWGKGAVLTLRPDGEIGPRIALPAPHTTCPAFGGPGLSTLYCTSATQGLDEAGRAAAPLSGATFAVADAGQGRPEPAFRLQPGGAAS